MNREKFLEFVRFCFVGGLSLIVDCGILFCLTDFFGVHYLYSAGISFTVSVIFILVVRRLCFQRRKKTKSETGDNFYRFKCRRSRIESSLHVFFRRDCRLALYDCKTRRNCHRHALELHYEKKSD